MDHLRDGIEICNAFRNSGARNLEEKSTINPIVCMAFEAVDRKRHRVVINSEPTGECEANGECSALSSFPEFQLPFARVGAVSVNSVPIPNEKSDDGIVDVAGKPHRDLDINIVSRLDDLCTPA